MTTTLILEGTEKIMGLPYKRQTDAKSKRSCIQYGRYTVYDPFEFAVKNYLVVPYLYL